MSDRIWHEALATQARPDAGDAARWRPIETAPKDVFLMIACPCGYKTLPWVYTTGIMHSDYKAGRWIDHAGDDMEPTHWRPLLDAPKAST